MTSEQWLPVVGWPGYEVSNEGRVRSVDRTVIRSNGHPMRIKSRVLRPGLGSHGYLGVNLHRPGTLTNRLIHRLVLEAFHGERPDGMVARHLDGNRYNNHIANLAWGTYEQNNQDIVRHGRNHNASKTHCPQGHPYDEVNTYRAPGRKRPERRCRTCLGMKVSA